MLLDDPAQGNVRPSCPQSVAARFPSSCDTPCCRRRQPSTPVDLQSSRPPATDASAVATDELRVDLRDRRRSCSLALFTKHLLPSRALLRVQVSTPPEQVRRMLCWAISRSCSPCAHAVPDLFVWTCIMKTKRPNVFVSEFRHRRLFCRAGYVRYRRTSCRAMRDHPCAACLELKRVSNTIESTLEN